MTYRKAKGGCSVTYLSNREFGWPISIGQSVAKSWPNDITVSMNPERPENVALVDYISNLEDVLLASPKFCDFFRSQKLPDLEFLKVTVLDHKGRVASDHYSIVQCCRVVDCIDQKESDFEWDGLDDPSMEVRTMVLNDDALGPNDRMIRPRYVPGVILYRKDLVDAINKQAFSGVGFRRSLFGDDEKY